MHTFIQDFPPLEIPRMDLNKNEETLTAEEYLKLVQLHQDKIKSVEIVSPELGKPGFGKFKVVYKSLFFKFKNGGGVFF